MKYLVYLASCSLLLSACGEEEKKDSSEESANKPNDQKEQVDVQEDKEPVQDPKTPAVKDIDYLIDDMGVGPVKLASTLEPGDIPEMYALESRETDLGEGEKGIIKLLTTKDEDKIILSFMQDCSEGENCVTDQIFVSDPNFKTASGIGVGSSISDFKKYYTPKTVIGNEYGNVYIYTEEVPNIGFEVLGMADVYPGKEMSMSDITDETLISKIYLFRE